MNTFLDYLVVLAVAALLLAPALYGAARERRVDRQIRAAAERRREQQRAPARGPGHPGRSPQGRGRRQHMKAA
ncbi:hypothetical protein [Streptomyces sp. AP-93]|uniref:hypothetical protein n=1 Tax=Streptomyces sp. AP-93 TaxID=2929048 RepID=UPI001FAF616A|nr:hypothetical protein [Streptomyces sp. AP-93]MCJ0871425.1 hypothetical protein [Streptomyces sp. AP-93]